MFNRPGSITKQYTLMGYLMNLLWILIGIAVVPFTLLAYGISVTRYAVVWVLFVLFFVYGLYAWFERRGRLKRRQHDLMEYSRAHSGDCQFNIDPATARIFDQMSLMNLHGVHRPFVSNFVKGTDWDYGELAYKIVRKTKYGDYDAATVYYGVMTTQLPRQLPNVFFDSKRARGRQFRFHFSRAQRHSLEGDFDNYFVTYFAEQYTIDSMSFISPDVMLALRDAGDYDIEIVGDRLYLYGSLHDVNTQIPDMLSKLQAIRRQLLDNIITYRDERLPYALGRQRVTPLGASLKQSKFWTYASIAIVVFYILLQYILVARPGSGN